MTTECLVKFFQVNTPILIPLYILKSEIVYTISFSHTTFMPTVKPKTLCGNL